MADLQNKIDFAAIIVVRKANPNGDPLDGNRPRINYDGYGEISDVCIKRKIRNRLQDMGEEIYVQSADRADDGYKSLKERVDNCTELKKVKKGDADSFAEIACSKWIDVRSFGQVFAFKGSDVSVGVRGPVTVQAAVSAAPVIPASIQIVKSVNSITGDKKSSDTIGAKHRIDFGMYRFNGSINVQLAEKTHFSKEDALKIKEALRTLFVNDCSSARPDGSMEVLKVYWWEHNCKSGQYSSAKVHNTVKIQLREGCDGRHYEDYEIIHTPLDGLAPEIIDGV